MSLEDDYFAAHSARMWLDGIEHQGKRLLDLSRTLLQPDQPNAPELRRAMDLRPIEEHFFVIAVANALSWVKKSRHVPALSVDIERFVLAVPEAKNLRDMREHSIEYLSGRGQHQEQFVKDIGGGAIMTDATSAFMIGDEHYNLGGRLIVQDAMTAAKDLSKRLSAWLDEKRHEVAPIMASKLST